MTRFPYPCLVADVGGTNARFALATEPHAPLSAMTRLPTGGESNFTATVRRAIQAAGFPHPKSFLLAVAGPVTHRGATLTNAMTTSGCLSINGPDLASALGLEQGLLLNDFEALCMALPVLGPRDVMALGDGVSVDGEPMVVVGPGTGLGVGALVQKAGAWMPIASEGGHVDLGPKTAEEFALWPHLGVGSISAEDLLSGRGLVRLHGAICRSLALPRADGDAAMVTELALAGDKAAATAVQQFLSLLARFAGDMALTFCARGGIFIGGGIAPRLQSVLDADGFVRHFGDKRRAGDYLSGIAVKLITAPDAALRGLAAVAGEPQKFALNYSERCWI